MSRNSHDRTITGHDRRRSCVGARLRKRIGLRSELHTEIAVRRCVHLLTHPVVANSLNQCIDGNSCAVVRCQAPSQKHDVLISGLAWLRTRGRKSRGNVGGRGGRRRGRGCWRCRRRRGLLRHSVRCTYRHCEGQYDENAKPVVHRSISRRGASVVQNSRAYIRSSQGLVVGLIAIARLARIYCHGLHAMARQFGSVGTSTRRDLFMSQSHHGIDPHGARRRDETRQKRDHNQQHNRQAEQPGVVHRHLEHKRLQQPRRKPTTD